jgi:hypothetical protein
MLEQYGASPLIKTTKVELQPRARLRNIINAENDPGAAASRLAEILRKEVEVLA